MDQPTILLTDDGLSVGRALRYEGLTIALPSPECFSPDGTLADHIKGIVLPGGGDINPKWYGHKNHGSFAYLPNRDTIEVWALTAALKARLPVLGICRGHQLINAVAGGTLVQDLPRAKDRLSHNGTEHRVYAIDRAGLPAFLEPIMDAGDSRWVLSLHHQAAARIAPGFAPWALAGDGLVEGIVSLDLPFVLGVQWHPEMNVSNMYDPKEGSCEMAMLIFQEYSRAVYTVAGRKEEWNKRPIPSGWAYEEPWSERELMGMSPVALGATLPHLLPAPQSVGSALLGSSLMSDDGSLYREPRSTRKLPRGSYQNAAKRGNARERRKARRAQERAERYQMSQMGHWMDRI